ncbi:MAG: exodeoxyribonuclease subunit beta, partial [Pseudomonadota bacterium]
AEAVKAGSEAKTTQLNALRTHWATAAQEMLAYVHSQQPAQQKGWDAKRFKLATLTKWIETLKAWAVDENGPEVPPLTKDCWKRLTPSGLQECRLDGQNPPDLPRAFAEFAQLQAATQSLAQVAQAPARLFAAVRVAQRLKQLKAQAGTFGFADMLERLNNALLSERGPSLRQSILNQYPVALIDEFQDTSPLQFKIFDQIYQTQANRRETALFLIGDPKQSIYGFRGADIYSYLQARHATQGRHYVLTTNYRSTHGVMKAVNHCFSAAEQTHPEGAFLFKTGQQSRLPYVQVKAKGRDERWAANGQTLPALTLVFDSELRSKDDSMDLFAQRCAEQITTWLNDPTCVFENPNGTVTRLSPKDIAILVRTGKEAAAARGALQKRGVASVYLSDKDSVFQTDEARDLVHWLRAVAQPQDMALVRAALALQTVGWDLADLNALFSDDEALDARAQTFRELHGVWQNLGVLAMLRQSLHRFDLAGAWLQQANGERRLTNFLHLAELLQNASANLEGEAALIRWLHRQIADDGEQSEEKVLRLESDADLVKVITTHKSKGLEYPVVCLPFGTGFREFKDGDKLAHLPREDGTRALTLVLDNDAVEQAERERLREDLRLLYVALTRARHALWVGFASVKVGNGKSCQTHLSALGYLVGGAEPKEPEQWRQCLMQRVQGCPEITLLENTDLFTPVTPLRRQAHAAPLKPDQPYAGEFDRRWGIASYSRLTRDLQTAPQTLSPLQSLRPADDESGVGPQEDSTLQEPTAVQAGIWHRFKRGPVAGNFLHDQLEWLAQEGFDCQPSTVQRLQQRCERAGYKDQASELAEWLREVVQTPLLGPGVCLAALHRHLAEMEFWLPVERLDTQQLDHLCQTHWHPGLPRPGLQASELHGMLMGFADLVFEHNGRYWVLDYKSNHLGPSDSHYTAAALEGAMADHRYDVQSAIYLLALHRLLKRRLGAVYDPAQHLGGSVYLFVRGMRGPAQGVCWTPPAPGLLQALDAMLEPSEGAA